MSQWSAQTQKIIDAHGSEIYVGTYESAMKKAGGFDKWVTNLGGVFAKCHTLDTPVETVADFRDRCEYVQGLMALFHFCYWNGQTWYFWLNNAAKAFYKTRRTSSCPSGTIRQLCTGESGRTRITNCNYGIDTLSRALGRKIWSRDYRVMEKNGAKRVTKAADLKPGDLVHFFRGSVSYNAWRHVAIVHSVDKDGTVWLADFGSRYIKTGKPLHAFPSEYTTYGAYWVGLHWVDLIDDTKKEEPKKDEGVEIIKNPAFTGRNTSPRTTKPKYIVIHYTGADGTAANNVQYFNTGDRDASADFFIDQNGSIHAYNNDIDGRYSWQCGGPIESAHHPDYGKCTNANSIGIELCTRKVGDAWTFTPAEVDSAVALTKMLMQKYGIPADHVIRHYDVTGKACPRVPGWGAVGGSSAWDAFKKRLSKEEDIPVPRTIKQGNTGKLVRMLQDFLGGLKVDGKFGAKTRAAVIKWQKAHKLTPDGVVGPKTWRAILASLA